MLGIFYQDSKLNILFNQHYIHFINKKYSAKIIFFPAEKKQLTCLNYIFGFFCGFLQWLRMSCMGLNISYRASILQGLLNKSCSDET